MALMRASGNVSPKAKHKAWAAEEARAPISPRRHAVAARSEPSWDFQLSFEFSHLLSDWILPGRRYKGDAEKRPQGQRPALHAGEFVWAKFHAWSTCRLATVHELHVGSASGFDDRSNFSVDIGQGNEILRRWIVRVCDEPDIGIVSPSCGLRLGLRKIT